MLFTDIKRTSNIVLVDLHKFVYRLTSKSRIIRGVGGGSLVCVIKWPIIISLFSFFCLVCGIE